ncbi:DAK2 domain-containing protein [Cellulomonas sp. Y8]|uniref:DAK2 domain-containing protein n=1 Tax=Cellulomonas sp. Y8 TaxID=2591145 RepID=UPI003D7511CD
MAGRLGDGGVLRDWLGRAVPALEAARERIDAVNVFPVPDGDTGTNVLLTVRGAAGEVAALPAGADGATVLRALARGALLSARGNSGVILSRYLGGLAGAASAPLPDALAAAAAAARSAVAEPEDGTVLTVAAVVADAARRAAAPGEGEAAAPGEGEAAAPGEAETAAPGEGETAVPGQGEAAALGAGVAAGRADLARISAGHPVLRSARVVDAGACALLVLLDALAAALAGSAGPVDVAWLDAHDAAEPAGAGAEGAADAHGYEVVALLRVDGDAGGAERVARGLADALAAVGDAVAVVPGDGLVTAHVHAPAPADAAAALGTSGARWTATVRTLLGPARPVVACTGSGAVAAALADDGAVAVLLPDGTPAGEARDAVRRATQEAQVPVHAAGDARAARAAGQGSVVVLPGDRLDAAALDPGWVVPAGASDDAGVLASLAALPVPATDAVPTSTGDPVTPAAPTTPTTPTIPTEARP